MGDSEDNISETVEADSATEITDVDADDESLTVDDEESKDEEATFILIVARDIVQKVIKAAVSAVGAAESGDDDDRDDLQELRVRAQAIVKTAVDTAKEVAEYRVVKSQAKSIVRTAVGAASATIVTEKLAMYVAAGEEETVAEPSGKIEIEIVSSDDSLAEEIPTYYNYEEIVSKPQSSDFSVLKEDLLTLHHSFGYDCKRRRNLYLMDKKIVIFAAGNLVHFLSLPTGGQHYLRTISGGGIGAITIHPSRKYIVVAENGPSPDINIFEYPSLRLYKRLQEGTQNSYTSVDFSSNGKLLASVGGSPDYMLTVWDWRREKIMLRCKAFGHDVFKVAFSHDNPGHLTTGGAGHIKFWIMAYTFTGLKLHGSIGRFGQTEISDIEGFVELPDGKVLSGSEWGNMLLWDSSLIKVEICRKGYKTCHNGPIMQFVMDEDELITVGMDGYIRVWDFEVIDQADSTDVSNKYELEPMREIKVGKNTSLYFMVKSLEIETPTIWYAQDSNGGIWQIDLAISMVSKEPQKLYTYHASSVTCCDVSPVAHLMATTGSDGTVRLYDYKEKKQLCHAVYGTGGTKLIWMPKSVDLRCSTIAASFEDGVVRILTILQNPDSEEREFALESVMKPHSATITAMEFESRSRLLATAGSDNTIFFIRVTSDSYMPLGFISTLAKPSYLNWAPFDLGMKLLVFCNDGSVMETEAPTEHDTATTYKISDRNTRCYIFKSVKSKIKREEWRRMKEEEKERLRLEKEEEKERRRQERREAGEEEEVEEEEEDQEEEEEEEEPELYYPEVPSSITHGFYSSNCSRFWITLDGYDAGFLYECKFLTDEEKAEIEPELIGEPLRAVPLEDINDVTVRCMTLTKLENYVLMGLQNGIIRVQTLPSGIQDIGNLGPYWSLNMHDNASGCVNHICISYDGNYVISVASDGTIFTYKAEFETVIAAEVSLTSVPLKKVIEKKIDDIDDPNHYSIEEEKQKAGYDQRMREAEEKKQVARRKINILRHQFKKVLQKNEELAGYLRLSKHDLKLSQELEQEQIERSKQQLANAKQKLAWEREKHRIGLEKLKRKFKDDIKCEKSELRALKTGQVLSTFRCTCLSDEYLIGMQLLRDGIEQTRKAAMIKRESMFQVMSGDAMLDDDAPQSISRGISEQMSMTVRLKQMAIRSNAQLKAHKALTKAAEKKKRKMAREAQWVALYVSKPDDSYEDPEDIEAIKEAKETIGHYKLKTAEDYVVPDHLRMNTEKKKLQLLELQKLIYNEKCYFNQKVEELRNKKEVLRNKLLKLDEQLKFAQSKLLPQNIRHGPSVLNFFNGDENRKDAESYTTNDLLKFKAELESEAVKAAQPTLFGGFEKPKPSASVRTRTASLLTGLLASRATLASALGITDEDLTPLEDAITTMEEKRLLYEQDAILEAIATLTGKFDAELKLLLEEKSQLEIILKNADLRCMVLYEELVLLKDFEKQENILAGKVNAKLDEKEDMLNKMNDCRNRLETKRNEIEQINEADRELQQQFEELIGDSNKFAEFLTKLFKKKIKRTKKKQEKEEGSEEDSEEESDESSDWTDSEEESDSEGALDLTICPSGCISEQYGKVSEMREKRMDIEEQLAEEKKNLEAIKKEQETLLKKQRNIETTLNQAEVELEAFQFEKQQRLNELDVVVTLKLEQIQHVVHGALPDDLTPCIVIGSPMLKRLQQRIIELQYEKAEERIKYRELRKRHIKLMKDRRQMAGQISELDEKCNEIMMLKFGRIVDFNQLESVGINVYVLELKEKLRAKEITNAAQLKKYETEVSGWKEKLLMKTRENTKLLDCYMTLLNEERANEEKLDDDQVDIRINPEEVSDEIEQDKEHLMKLLTFQNAQLEALQRESQVLTSKTASLYAYTAGVNGDMPTCAECDRVA